MKLNLVKTTFVAAITLFALNVSAHSRYMLPSHTVLSGDKAQFVTVSASISNDIFHHDMPLGDDGKGKVSPPLREIFKRIQTTVTGPDGKLSHVTWHAYARQSVADVEVKKSGTYRISMVQPTLLMTTFKKADGKRGRAFGNVKLPEGVTDVKKSEVSGRVESYVTYNKPNKTALTPVGEGLELAGDSHPNDLFVNEEGHFRLLFNGKGTSSAKVTLVRAGTNHRNDRNKLNITTDKDGYFNINFAQPGFYLLEADIKIKGKPGAEISAYSNSLYVTLEVFPE